MTKQTIWEHIRIKVNNLAEISDFEWTDFKSKLELVEIKKGTYIIKAGQVEKYFYFVHTGVLRAFVLFKGNDVTVGFSYKGDFSGAYDSFLEQKPSDWNIQAIEDCRLLRISFNDLMIIFDQYKSFERWGRIFNAQVLIGIGKRQVEVRSFSAEERFDRLLKQSPHIFQMVSQKHLASYLGMTPETFSRMRKQKVDKP